MKIYKNIPIYNKYTGKQSGCEKKLTALRCDYSGRLISDYVLYDNMTLCQYVCDYRDSDACFGAMGNEYDFGNKYSINMHEFLSEPYVFFDDCDGYNEEANMLLEIAKNKRKILHFAGLEGFLREFRIRAATKLLESGEIKPEELAGYEEYE